MTEKLPSTKSRQTFHEFLGQYIDFSFLNSKNKKDSSNWNEYAHVQKLEMNSDHILGFYNSMM